jgi:hypothetical protein
MNNKYSIIGIMLLVSVAIAFAFVSTPAEQNLNTIDNGGNIHYKGHVTIWKTEAITGNKILVADKDNMLTDAGRGFIIRKLNVADVNATNRTLAISLANTGTAPATSWTQLPSEITTLGMGRNTSAIYSANGTNGFNISAEWTATGSTNNINTTGLQWNNATTDGNLFAALQFANVSVLTNDQLQVVWQITIS